MSAKPVYWRLHRALLDDRETEVTTWLAAQGDQVQLVEGGLRDLAPPPGGELGVGLTILQDAQRQCMGWTALPGLYFRPRELAVSYYLPRMAPEVHRLNTQARLLPIGMLAGAAPSLIDDFQLGKAQVFIRPDAATKPFPGQVLDLADPRELAMLMRVCGLAPELLVWLSPVQDIEQEWRVWVVNRKVVAWSPYSWTVEQPWYDLPADVRQVAEQVAAQPWQPDIAYVVDIAETRRGARFLEFNAASTSGLYQVPVVELFSALRTACLLEAEGELTLED